MFPSKQKAFTLIELLVVMTISMTAVALVGGLSVDFINKYNRQAELNQAKSLLKSARELAFISETSLNVTIGESHISIASASKELAKQTFQELTFEPKSIKVTSFGELEFYQLRYFVEQQPRLLDLSEIKDVE